MGIPNTKLTWRAKILGGPPPGGGTPPWGGSFWSFYAVSEYNFDQNDPPRGGVPPSGGGSDGSFYAVTKGKSTHLTPPRGGPIGDRIGYRDRRPGRHLYRMPYAIGHRLAVCRRIKMSYVCILLAM